jgi:tetratricopeptide (TPR) repeat protein
VCAERGGDWKVKHIQSTAFVRWKQYKFKEALALFLQQQEIVGASAALCENIGHTYSSIGDLPKAEEYFERAIELLKRGSFGNRGGIYMGLGLVRDRLGKTREALPILEQALEHYQKEHTRDFVQLDSSIIAKAHMSVGKAHEKLGEKAKAAEHMADALAIFRRTVGFDSPLTANAMGCLGKVRCELGQMKEGLKLLKDALRLEIQKDAFHLETVWELLSRLKDLHMDEAKERQASAGTKGASPLEALRAIYGQYVPLLEATQAADVAPQRASAHHVVFTPQVCTPRRGSQAADWGAAGARRAWHAGSLLQDRRRVVHARAGLHWRRAPV